MNAQQARGIADEKKPKIEEILKSIETQAGYGMTQLSFQNLSFENQQKLLELGYQLKKHTDVINGQDWILVSW